MACDSPILVRSRDRDVPVPCGRCPPCKKRRVDSWVFRLQQEEKVSATARFVTLTYDTAHVPISDNGFMTLRKSDFQDYMKRLRKLCPDSRVRYFAVGEYGSNNKRPHFHAILFDVPNDRMFFDAWALNGVNLGTIHVGQVTGDSIAYCMKYIDKPGGNPLFPGWRAFVGRDDRVKEFSLMSKGLGKNFVTPAMKRYYKADISRVYCVKDGDYKIAMPRYYRDMIFDEDELAYQQVLANQSSIDRNLDLMSEYTRLYGDVEGYTFNQFVESRRKARYSSFYSKMQKQRLL